MKICEVMQGVSYRIEPHPLFSDVRRIVASIDGEDVGMLSLCYGRHHKGKWSPISVKVDTAFRRQGIATGMYDYAYNNGLRPITPDNDRTPAAIALWNKNSPYEVGTEVEWKPKTV